MRLEDGLEQLIDHRGKTPSKLGSDFTLSGVPVVSAMMVKDGSINFNDCRFVSAELARKWMPVQIRKGDVLLTSEAPLGRLARVPSDEPLVLGQRIFGLRARAEVLDSDYLYYLLQEQSIQAQLASLSTGTTVVGVRQSALRSLEIAVPDLPIQLAIAAVLGALDDKIAANADVARTADQFASATLSSMLRDGDVTDVTLGSVCDVNAEVMKPSTGLMRYIDIASMGTGSIPSAQEIDWSHAPSRARRLIRTGDIIWSTVRPNRRQFYLNLDSDRRLVGSTGLAVLTPRRVPAAYLYECCRRQAFTDYLVSVAEGSAYPAVKSENFREAQIPLLDDVRLSQFDALVSPLRALLHALHCENETLAELRDTLLPGLMSGRLRVKDAERQVEDAV